MKTAKYAEKDQTYMLYKLTQEQLGATLMPLGGLSKSEVRQIAKEAGLPVASKPDSQEVCFVADGGYADYIEKTAPADYKREGSFVDAAGNILGRHKGIVHYTVGQRKGIPLVNIIEGGAQERGKRGGTENVPAIMGMATAPEEACRHLHENTETVLRLRNRLIEGLSKIPHSILNGDPVNRLPGNVNFCFEGIGGKPAAAVRRQRHLRFFGIGLHLRFPGSQSCSAGNRQAP